MTRLRRVAAVVLAAALLGATAPAVTTVSASDSWTRHTVRTHVVASDSWTRHP